jgi:thiosulfate/3-mercaptopyruvate sulfurtransferase
MLQDFIVMLYQTLVSSEVLVNQLTNPNWIVVDCRFSLNDTEAGRWTYQVNHITGAHYAHLDEDLSGPITAKSGRHPLPDADDLCHKLGAWGVTAKSQVVVYDDVGGAMAARLWWLLRWLGHQHVALLDGGWQRWQALDFPVLQTIPVSLPTTYASTENNQIWLTTAQVQQSLEQGEIILIDARAAERFEGKVEPIDSVPGHVPGALNRPLQLNLDHKGCFKTTEQLRSEFGELLNGRAADQVVHMCGSGVTACHNLLAMEYAGLPGARLYPGSWSEWIKF